MFWDYFQVSVSLVSDFYTAIGRSNEESLPIFSCLPVRITFVSLKLSRSIRAILVNTECYNHRLLWLQDIILNPNKHT